MKSVYDVASLALFAGLAILFLQRSADKEPDAVPLWAYGVAALGCAAADILGNQGQAAAAAVLLIGLVPFCVIMLRPFGARPRR